MTFTTFSFTASSGHLFGLWFVVNHQILSNFIRPAVYLGSQCNPLCQPQLQVLPMQMSLYTHLVARQVWLNKKHFEFILDECSHILVHNFN